MARGLMQDETYYMDHVGREIIEKRPDLFSSEHSAQWLQLVFYYTPDEFEATFNEFRRTIKKEMPQIPLDTAARRKWIAEWLEGQDICIAYKEITRSGFTLSELFRNKESYMEFLRLFIQKRTEFIGDSPEYHNSWNVSEDTAKIPVASLMKLSNRIEVLVKKNAERGHRKFSRLLI
jgi:hypothetical protein